MERHFDDGAIYCTISIGRAFFVLCFAPSHCLRRGDFNVLSSLYGRAYSHTKQIGRAESFALDIIYALKWKVAKVSYAMK